MRNKNQTPNDDENKWLLFVPNHTTYTKIHSSDRTHIQNKSIEKKKGIRKEKQDSRTR